jgi:uncharacterized membrane protein
VSPEWIASLFSAETSRFTPLDFRLTAVAFFRLLSMQCSVQATSVDFVLTQSLAEQLVSTQVLSPKSLNIQAVTFLEKFQTQVIKAFASNRAGIIAMLMVSVSGIYSAVHTNAFQLSIPGSNQYQVINNFYPRHENASFLNVS